MALKVNWSDTAEQSFDVIVKFIEEKWSEKEVIHFIQETNRVLHLISVQPKLFIKSKKKNVRRGYIVPQVSLYYEIKKEEIFLLSFWDNRQDPARLKY